MHCPRCSLPLKRMNYERVETDMCESCWGFWLDRGELAHILTSRQLEFSEDERQKILQVSTASEAGDTTPIRCPKCQKVMEQLEYDESVHLVIDRCEEHGVWLDTGEIKRVQAVAEQSEDIYFMLMRKLKISAETE